MRRWKFMRSRALEWYARDYRLEPCVGSPDLSVGMPSWKRFGGRWIGQARDMDKSFLWLARLASANRACITNSSIRIAYRTGWFWRLDRYPMERLTPIARSSIFSKVISQSKSAMTVGAFGRKLPASC